MDALNRRIIAALQDWNLIPRDGVKTAADIKWQAVFFMGKSGSGKSYVRSKKYMKYFDFQLVDPDEIKKTHPNYDPENITTDVHEWSKEIAESQFNSIINSGTGQSFVLDGTGVNPDNIGRRIMAAKAAGYRTYLVYVYVPIEISIFRNRNRTRFVKESIVLPQEGVINNSFRVLKRMADQFKVIPNFEKAELVEAKKDWAVYPPPFDKRPPRPGSPDYGKPVTKEASEGGLLRRRRDYGCTAASEILKLAREIIT